MSFRNLSCLFQEIEKDEDIQDEIKDALITLEVNGNSTNENKEVIYTFPKHANKLALGLNKLEEKQMLTKQNRLRICAHAERADEIATAIVMLYRTNIYTLSNWLLIAKFPEKAKSIAASFEYLKKADIFTEKNKMKICTIHSSLDEKDSNNFGNALSFVYFEDNLTQGNFNKLCENPRNAFQAEVYINSKRNLS